MGLLADIQEVVQQFAEAASAALGLDVEVVDEDLTRIAGTGKSKALIGNKVQPNGIIKRFVLNGANNIIIENPGSEPNCELCTRYQNCIYKRAVYAAIQYQNHNVGSIGIIALSDEQVSLIEYNNYAMLGFVDKIANLISTKIQEYDILKHVQAYSQIMNMVMDNINKGIMILDKNYRVIEVNQYLLNAMHSTRNDILERQIGDLLPGIDLTFIHKKNKYQEVQYRGTDRAVSFLCTLTPVQEAMEMVICLLEDYTETGKLAYAIAGKRAEIRLEDIIGEDEGFLRFKQEVHRVARYDSTVLLTGESGTGKELFARAIHTESLRGANPFVVINCGAIPETLIESELFGYEKGAFTGASTLGKQGKFSLADSGTIFLDEVEAMPLYLQQKLLRVIENREIERLGGTTSITVDVRIVAATNKRLDEMVAQGEFRHDLYHRLNVISLYIPPLRERGRDVLILANAFIEKFNQKFNKPICGLAPEAHELFLRYQWMGNVRELQNTIEYAVSMCAGDFIGLADLPASLREVPNDNRLKTLADVEKDTIQQALERYGWSEEGRLQAAAVLGISRATIYRKIKQFQLSPK